MDEFDAKSVEEAIWDNAGVERISMIWPEEMMNMDEEQFRAEASKRMKKAGWRYIGYKPGRDVCVCESTMEYGKRTIGGGGGGGHAWSEHYSD